MQTRFRIGTAALLAALVISSSSPADALPAVTNQGSKLVDAAGKPVVLKGCNLGNWLILESWMFGGTLELNGHGFKDQTELYATLDSRFGHERTQKLMDVFRSSYVTPRDFGLVKSFGFNTVRLPFDYRLLQDDASPGTLRPDAFVWLDKALTMAEAAGVYVILDMHGVPGGQSKQDHTGQADQNKLWTDTAAQERAAVLWKAIADRYKDRSVVAAYDLINEPYGDMRQDVRSGLAKLLPQLAEAIRSTGDKHVIFYPGALGGGIAFYGKPPANIGFTEHYYPGLFGSKPATETHARLLGAELPAKQAYIDKIAGPYLVGEFNVVLQSEDPNRLMRAYYDRFAEYGWAATMWSYKLLKNDAGAQGSAWYMVTNADALPKLDAATASYEQIESFFKSLATAPIAVNEPLKAALTDPTPAPIPLAKYSPIPVALPTTPPSDPAGFVSADIGGAAAGHTHASAGDKVEITAGGSDINATADSFRFVSKSATGSAELHATIVSLLDSNQYAKGGVMARWGESAGAAMVMINAFPDGTIALISRASENGPTTETKIDAGVPFPMQLKLDVKNGQAVASYRSDRGVWKAAGSVSVPSGAFRIGLAACAHADEALTVVKATLGPAGDAALPLPNELAKRPAGKSLLTNGSFEQPGESADQATNWSRWGDWINHESAWSPTHDGKGLIGYHHWQIEGKGGSSGLWQDAKVKTGQRYTFTLFAQHDAAEAGKHDADTLELRLESITPDGAVTLNNHDFTITKLATGKDWTRVGVSGTAVSDTLRVLAVINSSADPLRGGAVKLDDATLTAATDGK
ncbi:MAG: glycoside hydrolase family protein [Phycisphaerales bacterium]|nr:glycoside hydrolase family protein [Phycisphaerales bacterium]